MAVTNQIKRMEFQPNFLADRRIDEVRAIQIVQQHIRIVRARNAVRIIDRCVRLRWTTVQRHRLP